MPPIRTQKKNGRGAKASIQPPTHPRGVATSPERALLQGAIQQYLILHPKHDLNRSFPASKRQHTPAAWRDDNSLPTHRPWTLDEIVKGVKFGHDPGAYFDRMNFPTLARRFLKLPVFHMGLKTRPEDYLHVMPALWKTDAGDGLTKEAVDALKAVKNDLRRQIFSDYGLPIAFYFINCPEFLTTTQDVSTTEGMIQYILECCAREPTISGWFYERILGGILDIDYIYTAEAPPPQYAGMKENCQTWTLRLFAHIIAAIVVNCVAHDTTDNTQAMKQFPGRNIQFFMNAPADSGLVWPDLLEIPVVKTLSKNVYTRWSEDKLPIFGGVGDMFGGMDAQNFHTLL